MSTKTVIAAKAKAKAVAIVVSKALASAVNQSVEKTAIAIKANAEVANSEMSIALIIRKEYSDKDTARPALKEAYAKALADGKISESSVITRCSNILTLAFPQCTPQELEQAVKHFGSAKGAIEEVKKVARGSLKATKPKAGKPLEYLPVVKKSRQGGSNRQKPLDAFKAKLALATSEKDFAKSVDAEQFAVAIAEIVIAIYPKDAVAFAEAIQKQLPNH